MQRETINTKNNYSVSSWFCSFVMFWGFEFLVNLFNSFSDFNILLTEFWIPALRPAERWHSHSNRLCSDVTSCKLHLKLPGLTHSSLCFIYRATTDPHGQQLPERESCACRPMVFSFGFCLITHS